MYTSGYLDQTGPSAAWRIGLLGAGRDGAAGCCGAGVDYGCASPGFEGAGEVDGFCADYWVGSYCHVACSLGFVRLVYLGGNDVNLLQAG